MKLFVFKHDGVWLQGKSVVIADSQQEAIVMLNAELSLNKLKPYSVESYGPPDEYDLYKRSIMVDDGVY